MLRILAIALVLGAAFVAAPHLTFADQFFHTERIPLHAVGGASLHDGFVVNIHANGPQIFAHEGYVLVGAAPDTTYSVSLQIFLDDPTCSGASPLMVPTASFTTNAAGNGTADAVFHPGDVPQMLRNATHGIIWQFSTGGQVAFETACTAVTLD